jgi:hypothetical protein
MRRRLAGTQGASEPPGSIFAWKLAARFITGEGVQIVFGLGGEHEETHGNGFRLWADDSPYENRAYAPKVTLGEGNPSIAFATQPEGRASDPPEIRRQVCFLILISLKNPTGNRDLSSTTSMRPVPRAQSSTRAALKAELQPMALATGEANSSRAAIGPEG